MKPIIYIGIDPGSSGAMAFIKNKEIKIYDFSDPKGLIALRKIYDNKLEAYAVLEHIYVMPGSSAKSSTTFITAYGCMLGYLKAFNIPYELCRPLKWQKRVYDHLPSKPPIPKNGTKKQISKAKYERKKIAKKFSLKQARQRFPTAMGYISREKDHDRAEALLIAEYCRIVHTGSDQKVKENDFYDFLA